MNPIRFFIDFDGTITKNDVVDMILERFGLSQWTQVEKLWLEGQIGSRECLARQMDLVSAADKEFKGLLDEVEVDPHFIHFLKRARDLNIPVAVVSDGFDVVIDHILKRSFGEFHGLLGELPVYSNTLKRNHRSFKAVFPEGPLCEHACANCKERVIDNLRGADEKVIFIGDGMSDRFAAKTADLTFAKGKLLKFCRENDIEHKEYSSFKEIDEWLVKEDVMRPLPPVETCR